MNLQNEDRNRTEIDNLRRYPTFLYVGDGGRHETCYDPKRSQRDNDRNTDTLKRNHNKEHLYCDSFETRSKYIITPNGYDNMHNEPRNIFSKDSYESICSRYLHSETTYPPNAPDNSEIEIRPSQNKRDIKRQQVHEKLTFTQSSDQVNENLPEMDRAKLSSDKTTYCRPVVNFYNQEFLYKTIEKNAKLRRLVTELVIVRQKEKEMENWKNYIDNLRKKHSVDDKMKRATSLQFIPDKLTTPDTIEDIYNTKFTGQQSNYCQNLLQDFYKPHDIRPSRYNDARISNEYARTSRENNPFKSNPLCYPTSSQGRLIMLERERVKRLTSHAYKPLFKTINEEKNIECEDLKTINRKGFVSDPETKNIIRNSRSTNTTLECRSTQTEFQVISAKRKDIVMSIGCNTNHVVSEKVCAKNVRNAETGPDNVRYIDNNFRKSSVVCIEKKLDSLIQSINNFMTELKTKSALRKFDQYTKLGKINVNYTRSDSCNMARKEKIVCGYIDDSSTTTRNSSIDNFNRIQTIDENLTKINDVLLKEIGKNRLITLKGSSLGEAYRPCSVQISVTIPTKEISTEVTSSLSRAAYLDNRNIIIEEIPKREDRRMAIAVNTDPLSLLAMLRVSTEETIRRLLSYVPTIDYYSYLSKLQGPSPDVIESQYVCNICGAAFRKPSALTDHIQKHELGKTRDCCVCRHVLDLPRRRPGLFKCQYCGQRFARAYCCELHQEACAKRLGKLHDVTSSLMLLR